MENPDCSECDLRANVLDDDTIIGLYEGAGYYHCGYYRPAYNCRMRDSSKEFCRVCVDGIAEELEAFVGVAAVVFGTPRPMRQRLVDQRRVAESVTQAATESIGGVCGCQSDQPTRVWT